MKSKIYLYLLIGLLPLVPQADDAARGLEIAQEMDRRDNGFGDSASSMTMVLRNSHGQESRRALRNKTMEEPGDGDKSLIIFDNPPDVKGTAFLSFTHKTGSDDQWLYLPALKRVKRISSSNKAGPFMGSEFAYEDIASQEVEKYTYRYLRDEQFDGRDHFVIERDPVDPKSGYKRQIVWIDKAEYRTWKVEYYDRKDDLLKTLVASNFEQYLGQYWRAAQMDMANHQTGKGTTMIWEDYVFDNNFNKRQFTKAGLAKVR